MGDSQKSKNQFELTMQFFFIVTLHKYEGNWLAMNCGLSLSRKITKDARCYSKLEMASSYCRVYLALLNHVNIGAMLLEELKD